MRNGGGYSISGLSIKNNRKKFVYYTQSSVPLTNHSCLALKLLLFWDENSCYTLRLCIDKNK